MLVDIGTSSFRKEFAYNKLVGPINETLSPSQSLVSFDTPLSIKKRLTLNKLCKKKLGEIVHQ